MAAFAGQIGGSDGIVGIPTTNRTDSVDRAVIGLAAAVEFSPNILAKSDVRLKNSYIDGTPTLVSETATTNVYMYRVHLNRDDNGDDGSIYSVKAVVSKTGTYLGAISVEYYDGF